MQRGIVKWYNEGRGIGIILAETDKKELIVSHKDMNGPGFKILFPGQRVEFEIVQTKKGLCATSVVSINDI